MKPSEVDFDQPIFRSFPRGWQSPTDLTEGFLLAAALELRARQQLNRWDPFGDGVWEQLPGRFRFDAFRGLLMYSEPYGRLPLLSLVWRYIDEVVAKYGHLRTRDIITGYHAVLSQLEGVILGQYATQLFKAAFLRVWQDPRREAELTGVEVAFISAQPLYCRPAGVLTPGGLLYTDSIWLTAFRLIEMSSPEAYIRKYSHRENVISRILDGGAQRGLKGERDLWPGWPQ